MSCIAFLLGANFGCREAGYNTVKSLPAPIAQKFPYEIKEAYKHAIWGGDNFEIHQNGVVHYLVLEGVDSPKPGQEDYEPSRIQLRDLITHKKLRIVINGLDDHKREIARVYVGDVDVNLELIQSGFGWYDGTDFADSPKFQLAQEKARAQKKGLWKNPDPMHPSEFESLRKMDQN